MQHRFEEVAVFLDPGAHDVHRELPRIEQRMREIIRENAPFVYREVTSEEARQLFANQPYKLELVDAILAGVSDADGKSDSPGSLSTYRHGSFEDLCRGPHVASTGRLGVFKLTHTAGAYWKGDEKNPMLQRIYGTAWLTQEELAERAMAGKRPDLVEPILPPDSADFVIKARHTIFYMTPLEYLLAQEQIDRVILTGQVTEQCILYSALDAYIRHMDVVVPRDAVAHIHEDLADAALRMMEVNMRAEVVPAADCLR